MSIRDSARWCAICQEHGDHHTDRHGEFPVSWMSEWDNPEDSLYDDH